MIRPTPYILLIAPNAPPKNGPEAIQVGRILGALDTKARGRLITTPCESSGWLQPDAQLDIPLVNFDVQHLRLPLHSLANRLLKSHRVARFVTPDPFVWITWMTRKITRALPQKADVIYSRSSPISAALLAYRLKQKLGVPWIMHLSDPWADNPYLPPHPRNQAQEAACFAQANRITLTTSIQASYYQKKYPEHAHKIIVSPNMMPDIAAATVTRNAPDPAAPLNITLAGSFYGERSPKPLVDALAILQQTHPELLKNLRVNVYGNAQPEARALLTRMPETLHYHGAVSFGQAQAAQESADILLSMEPELAHPLGSCFLPSKVLDCLALGKPLLAITPDDSETAAICREGYGWSISPSRPDRIAQLLAMQIAARDQLRQTPAKPAPERYTTQTITDDLMVHIHRLIDETRP